MSATKISKEEYGLLIRKYENLGWKFRDVGDDGIGRDYKSPRMKSFHWIFTDWVGEHLGHYYFEEAYLLDSEASSVAQEWISMQALLLLFEQKLIKTATELFRSNQEITLTPKEILILAAKEF